MKILHAVGTWLLLWTSQAIAAQALPQPSQVQIDSVLQQLLLCQQVGGHPDDNTTINQVLDHVNALADAASDGQGRVRISYKVLGTRFHLFTMLGHDRESIMVGWSPNGRVAALAARLRGMGMALVPYNHTEDPSELIKDASVQGHQLRRITPDGQSRILLLSGLRWPTETSGNGEGMALLCEHTQVTDEQVQAALGMPSTQSVRQVVGSGTLKPREWADRVISSGHPSLLEVVSSYRWLQPDQVERLFATNQPVVDIALVKNNAVVFTQAQVDILLARQHGSTLRKLVEKRYEVLTSEQRTVLEKHPATALRMTLRAGGQPALALLQMYLMENDIQQIRRTFNAMNNPSSEAIDLVLKHGSPKVRGWMAMEIKSTYTPQQIEAMLTDPEPDVQIGVLRRYELPITDAQYQRGIKHAHPKIAFWYLNRQEHLPSDEAIELGLNSPRESTRRGWVLDNRYKMTPQQIERVWQQPALRGALLGRPDWTISAARADECTVDPEVTIRFSCVKRPDYTLTHDRFKWIVLDWNQNVLSELMHRKSGAPDVAPFIEHAIDHANNLVLLRIARARDLHISEAQVQRAQRHPNPEVRAAFCKRQPQICSALASSGTPNQAADLATPNEQAIREQIRQDSQAQFLGGQFDLLAARIQAMQKAERLTPSGIWQQALAYEGLSNALTSLMSAQELAADLPDIQGRLNTWASSQPQDSTPKLLLAQAYLIAASQLQHPAHMSKDPTGNAAKAELFVNKAAFQLNLHKALAASDPYWYVIMLEVAQRQYWPVARIEQLAEVVQAKHPGFLPFHYGMLDYLSPKRCGTIEDIERYALRTMKATQSEQGKSYYARLWWYASSLDFGDQLFEKTTVKWRLLKQAFDDLVARHPVIWNLNNYARFACLAGDEVTARQLLTRIKDHIDESVWDRSEAMSRCAKFQ